QASVQTLVEEGVSGSAAFAGEVDEAELFSTAEWVWLGFLQTENDGKAVKPAEEQATAKHGEPQEFSAVFFWEIPVHRSKREIIIPGPKEKRGQVNDLTP